MQDLEEDPSLRSQINMYKDQAAIQAQVVVNEKTIARGVFGRAAAAAAATADGATPAAAATAAAAEAAAAAAEAGSDDDSDGNDEFPGAPLRRPSPRPPGAPSSPSQPLALDPCHSRVCANPDPNPNPNPKP